LPTGLVDRSIALRDLVEIPVRDLAVHARLVVMMARLEMLFGGVADPALVEDDQGADRLGREPGSGISAEFDGSSRRDI